MKTLRMALIALCGFAMTVGASSCKKDRKEEANVGEEMRIEVSLSESAANSKTHLDGPKVAWDSSDKFMLFSSGSTEGAVFGLTKITGDGTTAEFTGTCPGSAPYYGAYPDNVTCSEAGEFKFQIPQLQSENTNAGPMVGYMESQDGGLVFQNAMSWLKIGLKGSAVVKRIVLRDKNNAMLNGTLTVSCNDNEKDGFSFTTSMAGGTDSLEIIPSTGISLTEELHPFWFLVPVGSLESLQLCVYASDAVGAKPIFTLEKRIEGGVAGNTILTANVSGNVDYDAPELTLEICKDCELSIHGHYTAGTLPTVKLGVCYMESTTGLDTPTIENTKYDGGTLTGTHDYTIDIADLGLNHDKMYRIRTYVDDGCDVTYSDETWTVDWEKKQIPSEWINGKNPHPFTVANGKQVYFSQANLQYVKSTKSTGIWQFAKHQYDIVEKEGQDVGNNYANQDTITLFGWGTSGFNHNNKSYQPWSTSKNHEDYYAYSSSTNNLEDGPDPDKGKADWGKANSISNGVGSNWRTLTGGADGEWDYLLKSRPDAENLYGQGKVGNCTLGLIILPDDWKWTGDVAGFGPDAAEESRRWKSGGKPGWLNVYSYSEWAKMEAAGAVFLPATGGREGTKVTSVNYSCLYWSSSYSNNERAYSIDIYNGAAFTGGSNETRRFRWQGFSVRLVSDNK